MRKVVNDITLLDNLRYLVEKYEQLAKDAARRLRRAEEEHELWLERLRNARELLDLEAKRIDEHLPATKTLYRGRTLKQAALAVLKESNGAPLAPGEIAQRLRDSGYPMVSRFPGRALHAALLKAQNVEKTDSGAYRWVGPGSNPRSPAA